MTKFSVVIPVRKFNPYLKEILKALANQTFKEFETIVILDSLDNEVMHLYPEVTFLESGAVGPAKKRNIGANKARGQILAFLDDDAFPAKNWLKNAKSVFDETGTYALGGPAMTPPDAGVREKLSGDILESWLSGGFTTYRHVPRDRRNINDYPSVNLFVEKEAFIKVGGFDEAFWPGEDTKLCLDLIKLKKKDFIYDPSIIVYHHRRDLYLPFLKQISRYGRQRGQFARTYPATSRIPAYFVPSFVILVGIIGAILCIFSFPFRFVMLFLIMLYFWFVTYETTKIAYKEIKHGPFVFFIAFWGFVLIHATYGFNFILGLLKRPKLELRSVDDASGKYLGG